MSYIFFPKLLYQLHSNILYTHSSEIVQCLFMLNDRDHYYPPVTNRADITFPKLFWQYIVTLLYSSICSSINGIKEYFF